MQGGTALDPRLESTSEPGRARLEIRRVEGLYSVAPLAMLAPLATSVLLGVALWGAVPRTALLAWVGVNWGLVAVRYLLVLAFRATAREMRDAARWRTRFLVSLWISGAAFGSGGVLLFAPDSPAHQAILAYLLGGMVAGAVGTYHIMRRAFLPYSAFVFTPVVVRLLVEGETIGRIMGGMGFLYSLLMLGSGIQIRGIVVRSMGVTVENEMLKAQKLESLGVLAGGIAHDFNNLLVGIMGHLSLARADVDPCSALEDRLAEAQLAALRARGLTHQLLTFSRGGAPRKQRIDIRALLAETSRFALSGSKVSCDLDLPDELWSVEADEGQLVQTFNNLLMNAVQAMPEGGTVRLSCRNVTQHGSEPGMLPVGDYVEVRLTDQGPGVPPEIAERIFEPYFSTKTGTSGLGLTTAFSICRRHEGLLLLERTEEPGATFRVLLPASPAPPPEAMKSDVGIHGQGRILLMDDEPVVRDVVCEMLDQLGYEVEATAEGREAIRRYEAARDSDRPFEAVIMDLTVPGGLGGKETMEELLRLDPEVKAIVSSGYSDNQVMSEYWRYGFRGVLAKPYLMDELGRALRRALDDETGGQPPE